jgi:ureidoglycolate lyase
LTDTVATPSQTRTVRIELVTPEAFAPYGVVLTPEAHERLPIEVYGNSVDCFREPIESDQPLEYLITTLRFRGYEVRFLERHMELTQTFIPMGGASYVLVVAEPDCPEEDGIPALSSIRAFLASGDTALQIHRGAWHEIPFPLSHEQLVLTLSHQSLTAGLISNLDENREIGKLDVEKRNVRDRAGFQLLLELPGSPQSAA